MNWKKYIYSEKQCKLEECFNHKVINKYISINWYNCKFWLFLKKTENKKYKNEKAIAWKIWEISEMKNYVPQKDIWSHEKNELSNEGL